MKKPVLGIVLSYAVLGAASSAQEVASQPLISAARPASVAPGTAPIVKEPPVVADAPETPVDPATLFPDLVPLTSRKTSLIGGTIEKLDRVRDQFTLRIFGAGKMKVYFDPRTHIYEDGNEVSVSDLHPGVRVSIDTVLEGSAVFARNIRLNTAPTGEIQATVVSYNGEDLSLRDRLSPRVLKLRFTPQTRLIEKEGSEKESSASASDLVKGTLVAVKFGAPQDGHNIAQEVSILAVPGNTFTFSGRVTALDLRTGLLVLTSATDGKTYEIYLDPSASSGNDNLHQEADVMVLTRFDGSRYVAQNVTAN